MIISENMQSIESKRRRSISPKGTIRLKKPKIVSVDNRRSRLVTEVKINNNQRELWIEAENEYVPYMVTENNDAALCFFIIRAIRNGYDIECEAPVTDILLYKLREYVQIAKTCNVAGKTYASKIFATTCRNMPSGKAIVTTASLGVDSFAAINKFASTDYPSLKITHLLNVDGLQYARIRTRMRGKLTNKTKEESKVISSAVKNAVRENVSKVADELNVKPLFFESNLREFVIDVLPYVTFGNAGIFAHSFSKLIATFIAPGSHSLSHFDVSEIGFGDCTIHEMLNLSTINTANFDGGVSFVADTAIGDRLDKLRELQDSVLAQKYLAVCWWSLDGNNCSVCSKCVRTMIMLDYLGALEKFSNVFDVDYYYEKFDAIYKRYLLGRGGFVTTNRNGWKANVASGDIDLKLSLTNDERYYEIRDTIIAKYR